MECETIEHNASALYKVGLSRESEAVISAHFMHYMNKNYNLSLYSDQEFSKIALPVTSKLIFDHLIPSLLEASDKFVLERASAAKIRVKENYKEYGMRSAKEVGLAEMITEVMFDRQFLKGAKSNFPRIALVQKVRAIVEQNKPIKMVIPALPYKSSSPLKTRGLMPDVSEINFLLGLFELVKTIECIYREKIPTSESPLAIFTVICDGSRFNRFLNESDETITNYQKKLHWWIEQLLLSNYIKILDYQQVIANHLPKKMQCDKMEIRKKVLEYYSELMNPLLNPAHMFHSINKAIELDPDPETCHPEGRFIPLFKSLIYIVRYKTLSNYAALHGENYDSLYIDLTRHIFEPYMELSECEYQLVEQFILKDQVENRPTQLQILEYLRCSMLHEAWNATINYLAEIRSDRDLDEEPISACFPDYIRWTIHAKAGQLAILTTTAFGDPIQPWHGVGVFKFTKNNKIKLYTLPISFLEYLGATPITLIDTEQESNESVQPLFYVHPEIRFENINDLLEKIRQELTRKRKL